jgi:origin recognition complex subunit 4
MEKKIQMAISKEFKKEITEITKLFNKSNGHMLLVGMDPYITGVVLDKVIHFGESRDITPIRINRNIKKRRESSEGLFIIHIDEHISSTYQKILYFYLELSKKRKNCYVMFVSNSCLCLDSLEKRVISRFNHRMVFLSYISYKTYKLLAGSKDSKYSYEVNPSIDELINNITRMKYGIRKVEIENIFELLNPIHFAILFVSTTKSVSIINVVSEFRKMASKANELGGTTEIGILNAYYDLVDFGMIDKRGRFASDHHGFVNFVKQRSPLYLRRLLTSK